MNYAVRVILIILFTATVLSCGKHSGQSASPASGNNNNNTTFTTSAHAGPPQTQQLAGTWTLSGTEHDTIYLTDVYPIGGGDNRAVDTVYNTSMTCHITFVTDSVILVTDSVSNGNYQWNSPGNHALFAWDTVQHTLTFISQYVDMNPGFFFCDTLVYNYAAHTISETQTGMSLRVQTPFDQAFLYPSDTFREIDAIRLHIKLHAP